MGELDTEVIILNQKAFSKLTGVKKLEIVKGATHLYSIIDNIIKHLKPTLRRKFLFERQKNRTSSGGITELFRLLSEGLNAFLHPVAPWRDDLIQKATLVLFGKIF